MEESNGEIDEPMVLRPLKLEETSVKLRQARRLRRLLKLKVQRGYPPLSMESLVRTLPKQWQTCNMKLVVF